MSRKLPGRFLSLEDEDWDSFESIQPFHANGGNHLPSKPARTPVKNSKVAEPTRSGLYPSLPSPEPTPLRAPNKSSRSVAGRLFAQTQPQTPPATPDRVSPPAIRPVVGRLLGKSHLQTPPGTPERVSSPAIPPRRPQDVVSRPSPGTQREVSALPTPPKVRSTRTAESNAYSTPPVTPIRPKRVNKAKKENPRPSPNVEDLRGLAARVTENLSKLEESARQRTESRTLLESPTPTTTGSPAVSVRTLDEDTEDEVPSTTSRIPSAKAIVKAKRPSATATAQPHLDDVARLSSIINARSTSARPVGLRPQNVTDETWTDFTPDFFNELPSAVPHLTLWSAGGVGIFSNGQSLKYFQACDVAVLVKREKGEKVCGTETVNDVGYILHYEMGLGKTVTTIALIISNPAPREFKGSHATLVVTPNKGIMDHWISEIAKFAPQLRVCYYDSAKTHLSETADVIVCTYNQLRSQYAIYRKDPKGKAPLFQRVWHRVVLDEGHVGRNPDTQTAQSIWALKKRHGLCLTGTPAQNSNHDLYSLFRFLGVAYENVNDLETFRFKVCSKNPKHRPRNPKILNIIKRDFIVARNKSLIKLPKRTDTTIEVMLTPQERRLYSSLKEWLRGSHTFARIIRLRQVCDHPSLIGDELRSEVVDEDEKPDPEDGDGYTDEESRAPCVDMSKLDKSEQRMFSVAYTSSKIREMMRILKTRVSGQKTIIFTHFVSAIPSITYALRRAGIRFTTYSGDMTASDRESSLKKIAQDDECTVIIVSIMAGGVGLNITACNTVILLDPWWNPSAEEQAICRSYRIGQTLPVHVFRLIVKDSIEESIEKTQLFKREVMKDMYGQCPPIDKKTFEEWLAGP